MRPHVTRSSCSVLLAIALGAAPRAQAVDAKSLMVAIVADGERAVLMGDLLEEAGVRHRRVATSSCTPEALRFADVVVVDWPKAKAQPNAIPFGDLERWDRPTLLMNGTGDWIAACYGLPTAAEMEALDPAHRGPEMQRLEPPAGASTTVWRQGNFFHVPVGIAPVLGAPAESAWLVDVIRRAARFASDRPIVRHATTNGAALPADEVARRERIAANGKLLGKNVTRLADLLALPPLLGTADDDAIERLLLDVVADNPGPGTSRNNWGFWLKSRADWMVWDHWSLVWRLDPTAKAWRTQSRELLGDARAAPASDPEAIALATKVAQKYGGRALADLTTFTCWQGSVHCSWDRRAGIFRAENHHVLPPGARATSWSVAVFDTLAEVDLIKGGGPPPWPMVSAMGEFRELVVNAFLPALLLDPGTTLERRAAEDDGELRALDVRLSMRGTGGARQRLFVRADGTIERRVEFTNGRTREWALEATTGCGPLTLPSKWLEIDPKRPQSWTLAEPTWNPALPRDLATATDRLTSARAADERR